MLDSEKKEELSLRKIQLLTWILVITFAAIFHTPAYADELTGHSHEEGLRYLIKKNALPIGDNGQYNPNNTVTRGEFAYYLSNVLNLPTASTITFSDVPSAYFANTAIQNAANAGIITGYPDGTFKPTDFISRQHMAVMLHRAIQFLKITSDSTKTVTFKDENLINPDYIAYVAIGAKLGLIQGSNGYFMPEKNATIGQASTFIFRLMKLAGDSATTMPTYQIKTISNGQLIDDKTFYSYKEAEAAMTSNAQVIVQNNKILKMTSGFIVTNKYVALQSETLNDAISIASGTEMEYIRSDENKVRVRLAGQVGTINIADATLIPFPLAKGRSYYTNDNGEIKHVIIDPLTGNNKGSYNFGKAPDFMQVGQKYYSWNGTHFTNASGQVAGEAYNYYQFLPARSTTQYTAEELDAYIINKLAELEKTGLPLYQNATTKSKLIGLGQIVKNIEATYKINALLILSLAQHESAYGMSEQAQNYNNLFGLYVYDTNPLNEKFDSVQANIAELVEKFWQPNYITPSAIIGKDYANGAVVGTKAIGFNVKYASDPFWGAKIAGHYYRTDKALGFKDIQNPYTIGLTTSTGLNIRTVATTYNNEPLFTYKKANMPVIITSSHLPEWYEIVSDVLHDQNVYVHKDYVKILNTVK